MTAGNGGDDDQQEHAAAFSPGGCASRGRREPGPPVAPEIGQQRGGGAEMQHDQERQELMRAWSMPECSSAGSTTAWPRLLTGNSSVAPCRIAITIACNVSIRGSGRFAARR